MNKKELVSIVASQLKMNQNEVLTVVEAMLEKISDTMVNGDAVRLVGFGEFHVRRRKARLGRNPKTGTEMMIPETKTPAFMAGKALKDAIKGRLEGKIKHD
jgi:nucleoid DNA-binding protein